MKKEIQTTIYEWNRQGLVTGITDPLGLEETFAYDKNGRMTDKWDRDGYHTAYAYDNRGLVTGILYGDGTSVAYSYDALRRLKEVQDGSGSTRITSDVLGRVISVTDQTGNTVGYEWGSMNEKLRLIYPDGKETAYNYNDKGQLTSLSTGSGTITYFYDPLGHLKEKAFPNGSMTEYNYNELGMLEKIRHTGNGFEEEYSYQYDVAGNKTEARRQRQGADTDSGVFGYGYDALNRLTEVSRNGQLLRRYAYDAFGNRTVKEDYSGQELSRTTYRYNAGNQMISLADGEEEQTYTYDRRGNLTAVSRGEELLKAFTFNAANLMTSALRIKDGVEKRADYSYDAFGNRIGQDIYSRKSGNSTSDINRKEPQDPERQIHYTIDLTRQYHNLLMSDDSACRKEQTFYWDGNVAAMEEAGNGSFYMQDDLGSPMLFTDEEGEIRESYGYDEFGQSLYDYPEGQLQPFGYTGYQMEAAGGLYFAQARRYDAGTGRFVSEDKIPGFMTEPHTMNRYSYCWNQPMEHVDLNGNIVWPLMLKIGVLVALSIVTVIGLIGCGKINISEPTDITPETIPEISPSEVPSEVPTEVPADDSTQQNLDSDKYKYLTEEEKLFVATVCGESIGEGELGWRAISNVIMNRQSSRHYPDTVTEIIQKPHAFGAYWNQTSEYRKAMDYLDNRTYDNELYEEVISITLAIYRGEDLNDITQGSTLYFSPKTMNPPGSLPKWNFEFLEEMYINGIDSDTFRFFRYKDECL